MRPFELLLFSTDPLLIDVAVAGGVGGIIVDWENVGKRSRQSGADTQINQDTVEDLRRVRAATKAPVVCRINGPGPEIGVEIEAAIGAGADEILVPMVRSVEEVEGVLELVRSRCGVGILVETRTAVAIAKELALLPLRRVYVGLNDLAIERRTSTIFDALVDGTVEKIRRLFEMPFGFGGLTLPEAGDPIPCRLLVAELARLSCDFSFLRRSFHRDIQHRDSLVEIPRILQALDRAAKRSPEAIARDRDDLERAVVAWRTQAPTAAAAPQR
ncbi:MAG: aldolase/citrate lyase family protein [Actinomycetota bacterium]